MFEVYLRITSKEVFNQGLGGRLLDYGDVGVRTAGTAGTEINFKGVSEPKQVQRMLRDMIDRHEEDKEVEERIKRFEDKYMMGEITKKEFEEAKQKLRASVNREDDFTPPSPSTAADTSVTSGPNQDAHGDGSESPPPEPPAGEPREQPRSPSPPSDQRTPAEKLEELQEMKDKDLITEEEFESKKEEILDNY